MKKQSSSSMRASLCSQECGATELPLMKTRSNSVTPGRVYQQNNSNMKVTSNASITILIQLMPNSKTGIFK